MAQPNNLNADKSCNKCDDESRDYRAKRLLHYSTLWIFLMEVGYKLEKISTGWRTNDSCSIASRSCEFFFSTLPPSSVYPTNHFSITGGFFLGEKKPVLETYLSLLFSSEITNERVVLTQSHISPCLVNKSPMKILVSKTYYVHTDFQFSASPVSKNKLFLSINITKTDRHVIQRRQTVGILTTITYIVPECFGFM